MATSTICSLAPAAPNFLGCRRPTCPGPAATAASAIFGAIFLAAMSAPSLTVLTTEAVTPRSWVAAMSALATAALVPSLTTVGLSLAGRRSRILSPPVAMIPEVTAAAPTMVVAATVAPRRIPEARDRPHWCPASLWYLMTARRPISSSSSRSATGGSRSGHSITTHQKSRPVADVATSPLHRYSKPSSTTWHMADPAMAIRHDPQTKWRAAPSSYTASCAGPANACAAAVTRSSDPANFESSASAPTGSAGDNPVTKLWPTVAKTICSSVRPIGGWWPSEGAALLSSGNSSTRSISLSSGDAETVGYAAATAST
mmetsp:Transcript_3968/g.9996  ORF Transcript_3968/g.9996 Transcript_3968/m.9996 type:complete len:315 (+) Transcript_3968:546-1490(+)